MKMDPYHDLLKIIGNYEYMYFNMYSNKINYGMQNELGFKRICHSINRLLTSCSANF